MTDGIRLEDCLDVPEELFGFLGPHLAMTRRRFSWEVAVRAGWEMPARSETADLIVAVCLRFAAIARATDDDDDLSLIDTDYWLDVPEMGAGKWPQHAIVANDLGLLERAIGSLPGTGVEILFDETYAASLEELLRAALSDLIDLLLTAWAVNRFTDYQVFIEPE
jgi:hypothetical protein